LLGVGLFVLAAHTADHDTKAAILTAATGLITGAFALLKTSDTKTEAKTKDEPPAAD
jgi:glucose uptake protein GlcU